jgi:hypothetical protein
MPRAIAVQEVRLLKKNEELAPLEILVAHKKVRIERRPYGRFTARSTRLFWDQQFSS